VSVQILKMYFSIFCFLLSVEIHAEANGPIPFDQQIKEADGIIVGHYLRRKSIQLEDGSIATQMIFKMNLEYGVQSEFFGMEEVIVHFPGGTFNGRNVKVETTPDFVSGENVVLMIKNSFDRFWALNNGIGAFRLINYGKNKVLINSIYPDNGEFGQVKIDDFEKSVREIKGTGLKMVHSLEQLEEESLKKRDRIPASGTSKGPLLVVSGQKTEEEKIMTTGISSLWLLMILASMGGLFRIFKKKQVNPTGFVRKG
jgi:hypothetical protein